MKSAAAGKTERAQSVLILNANIATRKNFDDHLYAQINTNVGNGYIAYALSRLFGIGDADAVIHQAIGINDPPKRRLAEAASHCRHILLVMQDQLREDTQDSWYVSALKTLQSLDAMGVPLTVFSLSANAFGKPPFPTKLDLSAPKLRLFHYLGERAGSIGVRGDYTASVLDGIGVRNVAAVGCPSYFETGSDRVVPAARDDLAVGQTIGLTGSLRLTSLEDRQVYLLQGDFEWPLVRLMYDVAPGGGKPSAEDRVKLNGPELMPLLQAAVEGRVRLFTDYKAWKSFIHSHCAAVVGTRLHGAIVALNAGVPALVTNSDARAAESCEFLGIPWAASGLPADVDASEVLAACDVSEVNARYKRLFVQFADWAANQGLTIAEQIGEGLSGRQIASVDPKVLAGRAVSVLREEVTTLSTGKRTPAAPVLPSRIDLPMGVTLAVGGAPPIPGIVSAVAPASGVSLSLSDNVSSSVYVRHGLGGAIIGTDTGGALHLASSGNESTHVRLSIAYDAGPTESALVLWIDTDGSPVARRVSVGEADSAGPGYRVLRTTN